MKIKSHKSKKLLFYLLLLVFLISDLIAIKFLFNVIEINNKQLISDKYSTIELFEQYINNKKKQYLYTEQFIKNETEGIKKILNGLLIDKFIIYNNELKNVIYSNNIDNISDYAVYLKKINNENIKTRIVYNDRDIYIGKVHLYENENLFYIFEFNIKNILFMQLKQFFIFKFIFLFAIIIISLIVMNAIEKPIKDISLMLKSWNKSVNSDNEDSIVKLFHDVIEELKQIDTANKDIDTNVKNKIKEVEGELLNIEGLKRISGITEGLAHQINNYMASIKGLIELYKHKPDKIDIKVIEDEIDNLIEFADKFMKFARNPDIYLGECSLKDTIQKALSHFDLSVYYDIPDYDVFVISDSILLEQVLFNIFDNIKKYSVDNKVYVYIVDLPDRIKLTIKDNGPGFNKEILSNLYMPFNLDSKGHGLGIPTIVKICSLLNHKIEIKNQNNKAIVIINFEKVINV